MNDAQLLRYSRHILLPEIGIEGQERLWHARVLIVGAGGLGCAAAPYLAASGVGCMTLCDHDQVDLTNLQRQILHRTDSVGMAKVASAERALHALNPEINIVTLQEKLTLERLLELVQHADVVLDCSDNFTTRYAVNRACVMLKKPLVSGAATRFAGQVSVFDVRAKNSPCYHCLYPEDTEAEETRCAVMGVFAPLVGIIGSLQAAETLKVLLDMGEPLRGRLLLLDALTLQMRTVRVSKDAACVVCTD